MTTKRWRFVVHPLSGATPLHQLEVEASNWMGALRAARQELGEDGGVPAGASCAVAPDGTVTILDSASRRKFLLMAVSPSLPPNSDAPHAEPAERQEPAQPQPTQHAVQAHAEPAAPSAAAVPATTAKRAKFQTVAYTPGMELPAAAELPTAAPHAAAQPPAPEARPAPAPPPTAAASATAVAATESATETTQAEATTKSKAKKKKFETVAFSAESARDATTAAAGHVAGVASAAVAVVPAASPSPQGTASAQVSQPVARASTSSPKHAAAQAQLELLFTRDEEPGGQNPLTYRERAYLIPRGMTVTEAEAALRFALADLQRQTQHAPRGKLVNLAAFDHRWTDTPERPPLIVLEWRDWRGEPAVDYPAAARSSTPPLGSGDDSERLADVFQELHELSHLHTAVEGLDFVIKLLDRTVTSEAASACLYDINTDELRFVAVSGRGADALRGTAVARSVGLLGQACQLEGRPLLAADVHAHPNYHAPTDSRPGLDARNMLLCALVREGHLLGLLQLVNRANGAFTADDLHVVNYVAEALGEFLQTVRVRPI